MRVTPPLVSVVLILAGAVAYLYTPACAARVKDADALFEEGRFQSALSLYEAVYEESTDEAARTSAFLRSCQCMIRLYRYGDAVEKMISAHPPAAAADRARFLIVKAEVLKVYLREYATLLEDKVIDDAGKEIISFTPAEVKEIVGGTYVELWDLRDELLQMKTRKEGYLLNLKDIDLGMYPTIFDYVTYVWTTFLLKHMAPPQARIGVRPDADVLLVRNLEHGVDFHDPPQLLAASIMETASIAGGYGRTEARERWRITRLLLPLRHWDFFDLSEPGGDKTGHEENNLTAYRRGAYAVLTDWSRTFRTEEGQGEAGYEAAQILHYEGRNVDAVELCEKVESEHERTRARKNAEGLRSRIIMPELRIRAKTVLPPGTEAFTLTTKNLPVVHFQAYRVGLPRLRDEYLEYKEKYGYSKPVWFEGWDDLLRPHWLTENYGQRLVCTYMSEEEPYTTWEIQTADEGDYERVTETVSPPTLEPGVYLVLACGDDSFRIGESLMSAVYVNVTEIVLACLTGSPPSVMDAYYEFLDGGGEDEVTEVACRLYALDGKNGMPLEGVAIDAWVARGSNRDEGQTQRLSTDERGGASLELPLKVAPGARNSWEVSPVARFEANTAWCEQDLWTGFRPPEPLRMFIETDRPIYRPGDRVHAKAIVVRGTSEGYRTLDGTVFLALRAAGHGWNEEVFRDSIETSDFGSVTIAFDIPRGKPLGRGRLYAECEWNSFKVKESIEFHVEEYRRPEFEIVLDPADKAWRYGEKALVKGRAGYYFGGPVSEAALNYTVIRRPHISPLHRSWVYDGKGVRGTEVAAGSVLTDSAGRFTIEFTPEPAPQIYPGHLPDISEFIVIVEARDPGGRTIEGRKSYRAGASPVYLTIDPAKGFFLETDTLSFTARRLTVNDSPAPGRTVYEVYTLGPPDAGCSEEERSSIYRRLPRLLDAHLECSPNRELVARGKLNHGDDSVADIRVDPLPQGAYRVLLRSMTDWGEQITQSRVFIVAGEMQEVMPVDIGDITLPEYDEYSVGGKARFLIGSSRGSGIYHLELHNQHSFLEHMQLEGQRIRMVEIVITDEMKGGLTLTWFGAKDMEVHSGCTTVAVPWDEKKLEVTLEESEESLAPGEEYTWAVQLRDSRGQPAEAEVLAMMYDRSLEYYAESANPWLDALYGMNRRDLLPQHSAYETRGDRFYLRRGTLAELGDAKWGAGPLKVPTLRSLGIRVPRDTHPRAKSRYMDDVVHYLDSHHAKDPFVRMRVSYCKMAPFPGEEIGPEEFAREAPTGAAALREKFSDTAFFKPHILTSGTGGRGEFSFVTPEQLSSWRVKVFGHTADASQGRLTTEVATRKDLMVRVDVPRFFREGDKGTITALVHNESGSNLAAEVRIDVTEGGESVNRKINLGVNRKVFTLDPRDLVSFTWTVDIPETATTYRVRATARGAIDSRHTIDLPGGRTTYLVLDRSPSAEFSDSEERSLPILPSRQRLVESSHVLLEGPGTETLGMPAGEVGRTREAMVLRIEPSLAVTLLTTVPFLLEYPHESVEKLLNQYVPLSIMSATLETHPAVHEALGKMPVRDTSHLPWEEPSTERLIALTETPWVSQAKGKPSQLEVINLLDPDIVEANRKSCLRNLAAAQYGNGAFPWKPGGRPDPYMTLYVLAGLAEASRYGIPVPTQMARRALQWINYDISSGLEPRVGQMALTAYAAYVVTSYPPDDYKEAKEGQGLVRHWIEYMEDNTQALSPMAGAHLARTYHNLGEDEKAMAVLEFAMDGAREDPVAGIYWTPEKYSWIWYRDTLEKHALLLRALQEIKPGDERIPGMVKWLLFNRKGNVWESTKHSAAAVYALLDYLGGVGALDADETFKIDWGGKAYSATVSPDAWLDVPLTWEARGSEITQARAEARITKTGSGITLAGLTLTYVTDGVPEPSEPGMLEVERIYYRRVREGGEYHLKPIDSGDKIAVGDEIEVRLKIGARSQFEYMLLRDVKPAGFEPQSRLSTWKSAGLPYYEEHRDSVTNFFLSHIPHGEFTLSYILRPTKPGRYRVGAAILQSMYAPDMAAHSAGFVFEVVE